MYDRDGIKKVLYDIKDEYPGFDKNEFLELIKKSIIRLYYGIKQENLKEVPIQVEEELINKLVLNKENFRLDLDTDTISVQFIELKDFIKKDNKNYIKLNLSVYFYDNSDNNIINKYERDKYWSDIWTVTISEADKLNTSNCTNCGAVMNYNQEKDILECRYCGSTMHFALKSKWKLYNIEIDNN